MIKNIKKIAFALLLISAQTTMFAMKLHQACAKNQINTVKQILNQRPDLVNQHDSKGYAPLHYACYRGHLTMVQLLVKKYHAIVHIPSAKQNATTPLALAKEKNIYLLYST